MDVSPTTSIVTDMEIINGLMDMQAAAQRLKREGKTIGFVPTMGYLHDAHASLMRLARPRCDVLVVSIFVNPAQFGPAEDLDTYPRDFERDQEICREEQVDILFYPAADEMYTDSVQTIVDDPSLSDVIEGEKRPGHFRGVATVVAKLFNLVLPDVAVFGEKDAQQLRVIRNMVNSLHFPVEIVPGPIVREPDGLAMSSRNAYLDAEQRSQAVCLFQSLEKAEVLFKSGERDAAALADAVRARVAEADRGQLDYVAIVDEQTFLPVENITVPVRILLVVRFGNTRLLDNRLLTEAS